jgi:hypothetical protein
MKTKIKRPTLLWNDRCQTGCGLPGHAPFRVMYTWSWERWKKITPKEVAECERELGRAPVCEVCAAIERRPHGDAPITDSFEGTSPGQPEVPATVFP